MTFRLRSLMLLVVFAGLEFFAWTSIGGDLFGDLSLDEWSVKAFVLVYVNVIAIIFGLPTVRLVSLFVRSLSASSDPDRALDAPIIDDSRDPTPGT